MQPAKLLGTLESCICGISRLQCGVILTPRSSRGSEIVIAKTFTKSVSKPNLSSNDQWVTLVPKSTNSQLSSGSLIRVPSTSPASSAELEKSDGRESAPVPVQPSRLRSTKPSKRLLKLQSKEYRVSFGHANISNRIAVQLRLLREAAGLSQAALADKLGTKQSAIARVENVTYGKLSISMLERIAEFFDVAPWVELISYSTFLRRTADLSSQALLPRPYKDEFDDSGQPRLEVQLTIDQSAICLMNYISAAPKQDFILWSNNDDTSLDHYLK
ncbi:helix-turn-helix domain-containing protein [Achromobacter mucicolens]|uniref:helix-turn-helix domain-containing protein n=1 Tax=Achromobacter mucicolens TaxID=1389922 RepID=UPI0022F38C74|nr:helix-turn-helix transcriptional regulator [Achromobacter mucicolens]WBX91591.1 helix-turn-helix transcriptional regulator [Achromobacter mucicolens]